MARKRKSGEGTVRLRKDGRWEGRVVCGYDAKDVLNKNTNIEVIKLRFDRRRVISKSYICIV